MANILPDLTAWRSAVMYAAVLGVLVGFVLGVGCAVLVPRLLS